MSRRPTLTQEASEPGCIYTTILLSHCSSLAVGDEVEREAREKEQLHKFFPRSRLRFTLSLCALAKCSYHLPLSLSLSLSLSRFLRSLTSASSSDIENAYIEKIDAR